MHANNERLFDRTSVEYNTEQWFEKSYRSPFLYEITHRRLVELLALHGDEEVFELGCGPGTWTRVMASQARNVTAVDLSQEMIARARDFVRPFDVSFTHCDILRYAPTRRYDRVVSLRAIEYIVDKAALVDQLARLTREGGELVVVSKTPFSVWRGRRWAATVASRLGRFARRLLLAPQDGKLGAESGAMHMPRISPWRLARLLRGAGFERITIHPVIVGLPLMAAIEGDIPLIPQALGPSVLRAFNRLSDLFNRAPQFTMRSTLWLTESYAIRARKGAGGGASNPASDQTEAKA